MPREFSRRDRVAEELKRELGILIATQVKDPRVTLVAITDIAISPDLKHAKVYVGSFDVTAERDDGADAALAGLRAARGYLKRELGKRLRLRVMPELRFIADHTEREAQRLDGIIDRAVAEDRAAAHGDAETPPDHGPT